MSPCGDSQYDEHHLALQCLCTDVHGPQHLAAFVICNFGLWGQSAQVKEPPNEIPMGKFITLENIWT